MDKEEMEKQEEKDYLEHLNLFLETDVLNGLNKVQREALAEIDEGDLLEEFQEVRECNELEDFDFAEIIYFIASQIHDGMWSSWYRVLCNSDFSPGVNWHVPNCDLDLRVSNELIKFFLDSDKEDKEEKEDTYRASKTMFMTGNDILSIVETAIGDVFEQEEYKGTLELVRSELNLLKENILDKLASLLEELDED